MNRLSEIQWDLLNWHQNQKGCYIFINNIAKIKDGIVKIAGVLVVFHFRHVRFLVIYRTITLS